MFTRFTYVIASVAACAALGCGDSPAGDEVEVSAASWPSQHFAFAPDVKATMHIRDFRPADFCGELETVGIHCWNPAVVAALDALRVSANTEPPNSFDANSWPAWVASKEYRGYQHINRFTLTCSYGRIVAPPSITGESSTGYTKLPWGYNPSDVYQGPAFPQGFTYDIDPTNTCVTVHERRASRLSHNERWAAYTALGYDAPFIWSDLEETVCCNGVVQVQDRHATFPTYRLYINDGLVDEEQQHDLAQFLASGGTTFNPDGQGNLAPESGRTLNSPRQWLSQSYLFSDGHSSWWRRCPIDQKRGPQDGLPGSADRCTSWEYRDLSNLRGVGGESYRSINHFVLNKSGRRMVRQAITTMDGAYNYSRDCPFSNTGRIYWDQCEDIAGNLGRFTTVPTEAIRGVPGERIASINNFIFRSNNAIWLRQTSVLMDLHSALARTCPVYGNGPNYSQCVDLSGRIGWQPIDLDNLRGTGGGERYISYKSYVYRRNGKQILRQSEIDAGGWTTYMRDCPVDDVNGIQWAGCTDLEGRLGQWTQYDIGSVDNRAVLSDGAFVACTGDNCGAW
jgi:hypothetical protein